jgi:hypothetical protein
MGILDTVTQVHTPIDLCYDCIFSGCRYEPITTQIDIDEKDWGEALRKAQDRIIRDMLNATAVPPEAIDPL